jgi:hypothetical protein
LVFARPISPNTAQSNLVISTARGRQFIFILKSLPSADKSESDTDLLVICRATGALFIEETFPVSLISETVNVGNGALPAFRSRGNDSVSESKDDLALDEIVGRQRQEKVGRLYGDHIRVSIGQIVEQGSRLVVPFSVISSKSAQRVGSTQVNWRQTTGIFRRARWTTFKLPFGIRSLSEDSIQAGALTALSFSNVRRSNSPLKG